MEHRFAAEQFFDLPSCPFSDLLRKEISIWNVLPKLEEYIRRLFAEKKVVGNYKGRDDVYIGEGTFVHQTAEILGPAIIGKNCKILHAAYLRESCLLGDNVIVGHATEIKHTVMLNESVAAHLNYVGDSIVGNRVNIAGGAMLANFRLDRKPIIVKDGKDRIETGLEKFGAVIGDDSIIGVNAVLNPGTILGKKTLVYPLVLVSGTYSAGSMISASLKRV